MKLVSLQFPLVLRARADAHADGLRGVRWRTTLSVVWCLVRLLVRARLVRMTRLSWPLTRARFTK